MSTFKDVLLNAYRKGILLDTCNSDERQYWNGAYTDLCGMSYEDALKAQLSGVCCGGGTNTNTGTTPDTPEKLENIVTLEMQSVGDEYELVVSLTEPSKEDLVITCVFDGENKTIVIPAGQSSVNTGIQKGTKYATLSGVKFLSSDEGFTFKENNLVKDGMFTLSFVVDGQIIKTEQIQYGASITEPDVQEKEGYTFAWDEHPSVMPDKNLTVVGKYTVKSYELTWVIDGVVLTAETINYGTKIVDKVVEPKEGYTFAWEAHSATMPADDLTINGTYTINEYTLTIINGNGEITQVIEFNSLVEIPVADEKVGYDFLNWTTEDGEVSDSFNMPAHDVTLVANYQIKEFTYKFISNGNEVSGTAEYNSSINAVAATEKEGYEFVAWLDANDNEVEFPFVITEDVEFVAKYEILSFNVQYFIDDEEYVSELVEYNAPINLIAIPVENGYSFTAWEVEGDYTTMPAQDVIVRTVKTANLYNVTIKVEGEEDVMVQVPYNTLISTVINPVDPTLNGYTFTGWESDNEGVTFDSTMPYNDVTFIAQFEINVYHYEFIVMNEIVASGDAEYKTQIELPEEPVVQGYTFKSWDDNDGNNISFPYSLESDVTFYGNFEINKHSVHFLVDDVEVEVIENVAYGTALNTVVAQVEEPSKNGYTFMQWNIEDKMDVMPDFDVNVNAQFEINRHDVHFFVDGVEVEVITGVAYHTELSEVIAQVAEPTKEGYTFVHWIVDDEMDVMPDFDVNVNAHFNINTHSVKFYVDDVETNVIENVEYGTAISEIIAQVDEPTKEGYTFVQWEVENDATELPDNDIRIDAKFEINSYTVTYLINGEATDWVDTFEYDAVIEYRADLVKEGYYFNGWKVQGYENNPVNMPATDLTVDCEFDKNTYTVTFVVNNEEHSTANVLFEDTIPYPQLEEVEGYTWGEWKYNDAEAPVAMPATDITVTIESTVNEYALTFKVEGYDDVVLTVAYGTELAAMVPVMESPIEKDGKTYTFHWIDAIPATMPSSDLVINGEYVEKQESSIVYYGVVRTTEIDNVTESTFTSMTSLDAEEEPTKGITIVVPANPEYADMEDAFFAGTIKSSAFRTWLTENDNYYLVVAIPSQYLSYKLIGGDGVTDYAQVAFTKITEMTIDGSEYNIYGWADEINSTTVTKYGIDVATLGYATDENKEYTLTVNKD